MDGYARFVDKQGFPIILVVCIAIIGASAYTRNKLNEPWVAPTPPPAHGLTAAQLWQESLQEAQSARPVPTPTPKAWRPPLDTVTVISAFDTAGMQQSTVTGIWSVHDATDFAADSGTKVYAISSGVVLAAGEDALRGHWIEIDHHDEIVAHYGGLGLLNSYLPGDTVRAGDVIGYTGDGPMEEQALPPHLHLRVTNRGQAVDPVTLWQK